MKVALIAGFFTPVLKSLEANFTAELKSRSIIWIPQLHHGSADPGKLKQNFFDRLAKGASGILILLAVLRGHKYITEIVEAIIAEGRSRSPNTDIQFSCFEDARSPEPVVAAIRAFGVVEPEEPLPESLDELESWAQQKLKGKILLHSRALNGAKKSRYVDPALIYRSLLFLGNEYRELRINGYLGDSADRCQARLLELGLELTNSITPARAGEQGEDYYVDYPSLGETQFLKHHLKKGTSRDERRCFRVYFFWDEIEKLVVVGWLPSHLGTRLS
jgi:hypothetical protein